MDEMISRQAVLKLLSTMPPEEAMTKAMLIQSVQQMDAAQPKSYREGYQAGFKDAQPEPRWVSCSERLPEHGGRYLISVLDGINRRTTVAPYLPRCKAWTMTGRMAYWKVIAWMPLPEPYKEDDHEIAR